ncbi:methylmalonyl-CoA mutase family protein [Kordiimonas sp.]|uniref:methylmalonyl-CoA mutase family protein n=1 Tax=Kordiimonas sp. TaxID=1970157 RepID=UPI003A8E3C57
MADKQLNLAADFPHADDAQWMALVEKALAGKPFDKVMRSKTYDGIAIEALYTRDNARIEAHPASRNGEWLITAPHWSDDPARVNAEILEDLERGASAFAVRMQAGAFPGLAVGDLDAALSGVYLNMARFQLMPGEEFEEVAEAMLGLIKSDGHGGTEYNGTLGVDPLGTLAQTGRLKDKAEIALEKAANIAARLSDTAYQDIKTFNVDASVYHIAGATEAQELAMMLATGVSYLRAMVTAGMSVQAAAAAVEMTLAADADIFIGIAKFRAARRLWARVVESCGADSGTGIRINAVTSLRMLTIKDPWVNVLRGTAACFAAGVGGANAITVLPHDTLLGMSGRSARRIARNIQIILSDESSLSRMADPAAGSYAIESFTSEICDKAWGLFQKIESEGGVLPVLKSGSFVKDIEASWRERRSNIAKRKDAITGVSEFPDVNEKPLKDVGPQPALPSQIPAAGETLAPLPFHRLAEEFEVLRLKSDAMLEEGGMRPRVFIAGLGSPADFTARATFARSFFEAGGIEAIPSEGFEDMASLKAAYSSSEAPFAVICGSDAQYESLGLEAAEALIEAGCSRIYLAGRPSDPTKLEAAGVGEMIYMGCDVLDTLTRAYELLGGKS